jgi:hypothetical protein
MQKALLYLEELDDVSGEAADTGSATHHAIAAYHQAGGQEKGVEVGYAALHACLEHFPLASRAEAEQHLENYILDPRNSSAEVIAVEQAVKLVLPPAPGDPTGGAIHIEGTVDQVRRHEGQLMVFDVKTGSTPGWQMLHDYLFQVCAYALGATQLLGEPVVPGYLIRTQGYRRKGVDPRMSPEGILWGFYVALEQCRLFLDQLRSQVAAIRSGEVRFGPGAHCSYCPLGGIWNCTQKAEKIMQNELALHFAL